MTSVRDTDRLDLVERRIVHRFNYIPRAVTAHEIIARNCSIIMAEYDDL